MRADRESGSANLDIKGGGGGTSYDAWSDTKPGGASCRASCFDTKRDGASCRATWFSQDTLNSTNTIRAKAAHRLRPAA